MELWRRLNFLLHRPQFEADLDEEMRFHLEMKAQASGSRDRARAKFGNAGLLKEVSREMWGWSSLERLFQDLRYAIRQLMRNPGFATVAILSLALGIGANTAIFGLIDHVMLRLLPVSHPEELAVIRGNRSYPEYEQIRDHNQVFSATLATHLMPQMDVNLEGRSASQALGELVSGNYFQALGVGARIGRTILPDDDRAAESGPVAVISYAYWQRMFGGSVDVLGRKIQVRTGTANAGTGGLDIYDAGHHASADGAVLTIVGVAPPEFFGDTVGVAADVWIPITMQPAVMPGRPFLTQRNANWVNIMGRRTSGISEEQTSASLNVLYRQILADAEGSKLTEQTKREIAEVKLRIEPGEKGFGPIRREFSQPLLILMTVVGLVLLIACLNVANLLLARATVRRREISVRLSLGAGRVRLIRQLLTESLVLSIAGGAVGVLIALLASKLLIEMLAGVGQEISIPFETDWRTLGFTAVISIATGILFGLAPAFRATRITLAETMKESSRGSGTRRAFAAKILVAAQVAVSMLLLIGAGLFLRTLYNLKAEDVGYNPDHLVLMRVDPVSAGYRGAEVGRAMQSLLERVRAMPGVRAATFSENGLFSGTESGSQLSEIEGFTPNSDEDRSTRFDQIGPGYFTNIGIPILLGRDISERDAAGALRVAVINDTMAKFYFKGSSPIGKHFVTRDNVRLEIAGVVRDAQDHDFRDEPVRRFYVSYFQPIDGITTANFEVRTVGNSGSVMAGLRNEARAFNRNLAIISIRDVRQLMDANLVQERMIAKLSGFFAALAILLAGIGLYGVMSYSVSRRTNEIGIRMALGAPSAGVATMILREAILLIGAGALLGIGAALAVTRLIKSFLYGLTTMDPVSFAAAAVLLALIGVAAAYWPARRASKIDPMIALRYE